MSSKVHQILDIGFQMGVVLKSRCGLGVEWEEGLLPSKCLMDLQMQQKVVHSGIEYEHCIISRELTEN